MLERLIHAMRASGVEPYIEDILDMFWLTAQGRRLSLHTEIREAVQPAGTPPLADSSVYRPRSTPSDGENASNEGERVSTEDVPVYATGQSDANDRKICASPVAIPAGRALPGRLKLARALRPFHQRRPSRQSQELDEMRTVETTAELGGDLFPVFRPLNERWFDVDVVLEDDPAIALWRDTMREFCQMLSDTGAFRDVRSWRLRMPVSASTASEQSAYLETPTGTRASVNTLLAPGVSRVIFFVTHGMSPRWLDGSYARLLAPWLRASSVVLLHLLDRNHWKRCALGEPQGSCYTTEPGVTASNLRTAAFWWKLDRDEMYARLPAPVVMLTPSSLSQWAHMQMARGRRSHVFLLSPQPPIPADVQLASPIDVERAVDLLREASSAAFRLAVYLSTSAFTIPVARLVQEAQFGAAAQQSDLAEVLLSGLVTAHSAPGADPNELYYYFLPKARAILMRSLRDADAQSIAAVLERRLSQYLQQIQGRSVTFHSLIPDESGKFELPEWAQPFAHVGLSLLGKSVHGRSTVASSPDKPRVPSLWILVAGTGSNELAPTVLAAAKRVGTWLADNRYGLITCGWQGVDRVVAESFANALSNADLSVDDYLVHVLKRDRIPAFTNGRRVHVDNIRQEFTQSVERADAVLLIGGLGGTRQVGKRALKVRVPVYPLASTGGDAKWILEHILQDWNKFSWLPISRSQFSVLRNEERALDVIAASLRQNVNADRSEESPRDDSKGCDPDPHPKWVLVAGSSRDGSKDDFSRFAIACQSLGTELARSGFAIVVGSFSSSTADHHVLRGALETAEARTLVIRPQSAPARSEASFFLDVPVESAPGDWKAVRPKQLDRADALLLIAGGQGTGDVFAAAQSSHRSLPILLVPAFGGFAARKYAEYRGEYLRSGVARDTLKRLEQWDDSTPAAVVSILRILLGLRATYLLTWNPAYGTFRQFESVARAVRESGAADISWSVGWPGQEPPMRIAPGDRVFFMRHGSQRPGLIGSGEVIGEKYEDVHWSENQAKMGNRALYAPVRFDALREFPFIPLDELIEQTKEESLWTKVGTGHLIEPRLAQCLEDLWKQAVAPPGEAVAPLPPPNDPDEFESLCLELWREIWQDPDAQKHARRGQPDDGVDIVGQYQGKRIGIQCKLDPKTQHASLAVDQLDSAVHKAERFQPPLSSFILATIAPRDEQLLQRAHQLTEEQRAKGGFEVEVWFWPDIWTELRNRTELLERIRGSDAKSGQQAWPHLERTMENAQLHEAAMRAEVLKRELAVAHEVQRGFLPSAAPSIPGYEFFEFYEPANQLGGDYYDYVELPGGRLAVVMADVSGKGISATLLMAKLSAETRYCLASEPSPVAAMGRLNRLFCDSSWEDRFVTMVLAVLDPRRHEAVVVNAGHLPPFWRRGPARVEAVGQAESRLPLGVDRDVEYVPCAVPLAPGQSLVLYTDGIIDAMNQSGQLYGLRRLLALLATDVDRPGLLGRRILDDVKRFVGGRSQSDDMCLTCVGRSKPGFPI